ncbi:DMT family transporter [Streptococcus merionis]|uniref:DMT family transporter n=1 Tax=Streptococcus merionis TaxID=400065 RepID=UPI003514DBB9
MQKMKGAFLGLLSGMFWGLDTVLNGYVLTLMPFILTDKRLISATLLLAFCHDFISAIMLTIGLIVKGKLDNLDTLLKKRSSHFVMIAALFAGPIGMRAYLVAVESIGASLTATISATYPAVAAILGAVFLKDYLNKKGWFGLSLVILAIIVLGFSDLTSIDHFFLGGITALISVFGWASESVITAYGMKDDILPEQALAIRQWTSSIAYFALMCLDGDVLYSLIQVVISRNLMPILLLATVGTLSYLFYYLAINKIGPVKATGLNVTYSIWTVIFSILIMEHGIDLKLMISGLFIIIGVSLIVKN